MKKHSFQLLVRALLLEGGLLAVALVWGFLQGLPLREPLTPTIADCLFGVSAGLLLLLVNYAAIEYGSRHSAYFKIIKQLIEQDISPLFKHLDLLSIVAIAIISGLAEEMFFRGVLQANIGLWLSSLFFGVAHIWRKTAVLYGIYASVIGLFFGGLYLWSGSLWVPILAHIVNNFVAILYYVHGVMKSFDPTGSSEKQE